MASVAAPTLAPRIHSFVSGFSAEDLERLRPHITASSDEIYVGKLSESNYVETFSVVKEGELMVLWYSHLDKVPEKRHSTIGVDSREECFVTAARTLLGKIYSHLLSALQVNMKSRLECDLHEQSSSVLSPAFPDPLTCASL